MVVGLLEDLHRGMEGWLGEVLHLTAGGAYLDLDWFAGTFEVGTIDAVLGLEVFVGCLCGALHGVLLFRQGEA